MELGDDCLHTRLAPYLQFTTSSFSPEAFQCAENWLTTCTQSHERRSVRSEYLPSRLLDVSADNPRIVLRSEVPGNTGYLALSYCWGSAKHLTTKKATLEQYRSASGIPLRDFPKTILDAVTVTRRLGFRYLWVDSLCIIQDDEDDWIDESTDMGKIYHNADTVIAATVAASAAEGFLRGRPAYNEGVVSVSSKASSVITARYRIYPEENDPEPLDTRGWAYQERILSRRYLSFGKYQMQWSCKEGVLWESGESFCGPKRLLGLLIDELPDDHISLWRYVLGEYFEMKLSRTSDNLVALSAVASRFQSLFGGTYMAGIWKEELMSELQWQSFPEKPQRYNTPEPSYAPTWSWASVIGRKSHYYEWTEEREDLAEFVDASVILRTNNPFGPVRDGTWIKLRGKLFGATISLGQNGMFCLKLDGYNHDTDLDLDMEVAPFSPDLKGEGGQIAKEKQVYARRITTEEIRNGKGSHDEADGDIKNNGTNGKAETAKAERPVLRAFALPLCSGMIPREDLRGVDLLVLGPSGSILGCFERLGKCSFRLPAPKFGNFIRHHEDQEVFLV